MIASRIRSIVLAVLVAGSGLLLAGCPDKLVFIDDAGLEAAVRREIGKPFGFLSRADMLDLFELDARDLQIRDIEGLQFALNLDFLDLSNNTKPAVGIGNISQIMRLTSLKFLDISNNDVTDILPIAGLRNLKELVIRGNLVFNIEPIVTNASFGVLRQVTLSLEPLLDENDEILPAVAEHLVQLENLGVAVTLVDDPFTTN